MWDPETTQACNGFLVNFTAMYSFSRPSEPQGYSTQKVKQIAQQYLSDLAGDASGPNIIFIMNESWADFTRAGQLDTSEPVTPFIDSLAESGEAVYGNTVVPVVNLKRLPAPATFLDFLRTRTGSIPIQVWPPARRI